MKRTKMMLLSLALFAVVGGTLAFKAKFINQFCTAATIAGVANTNLGCRNPAVLSVTDLSASVFVATTTYDNNQCKTTGLRCTTTAISLITD